MQLFKFFVCEVTISHGQIQDYSDLM